MDYLFRTCIFRVSLGILHQNTKLVHQLNCNSACASISLICLSPRLCCRCIILFVYWGFFVFFPSPHKAVCIVKKKRKKSEIVLLFSLRQQNSMQGSRVSQLELWPHWHPYYWLLFHLTAAEADSFHGEKRGSPALQYVGNEGIAGCGNWRAR